MRILYSYIPCYNEEGNISALLDLWISERQRLKESGFELRVVPIDDKSKDSTLMLIREAEKVNDCIEVIAHEYNQNLCGGLNSAINHFLKNGQDGDIMSFMDGDNTHKPIYIHDMIKKLQKGFDCVIASRYQEGSMINGVPKNREFLSDSAKQYYSIVLNVPNVKDYTCGYRIYTYAAVKKAKSMFGDKLITMKSFACMMELLYKLHKSGAKFGEIPFTLYYDNKVGNSSMRIIKTMTTSLFGAIKLRFDRCKKNINKDTDNAEPSLFIQEGVTTGHGASHADEGTV